MDYLDDLPFPVWKDRIIKIENVAHYPHIDQVATINKLLADYNGNLLFYMKDVPIRNRFPINRANRYDII
jgi:hypothetical protein